MKIEKITIPIPPLEIQQKIVDILDNFDKLVHDISIGLPAEIKARKQQYEYCRDGVQFKTLGEVVNYQQPTPYIVKSTKYNNNINMLYSDNRTSSEERY